MAELELSLRKAPSCPSGCGGEPGLEGPGNEVVLSW